jgi:hypothetical protein
MCLWGYQESNLIFWILSQKLRSIFNLGCSLYFDFSSVISRSRLAKRKQTKTFVTVLPDQYPHRNKTSILFSPYRILFVYTSFCSDQISVQTEVNMNEPYTVPRVYYLYCALGNVPQRVEPEPPVSSYRTENLMF